MTPDELAQRYFLARVLWWRNDLEQLDAAAIAELVKALKSADVEMREQVRRELPEVWDAYAKEENREQVKVWLAALVAATAAGVVNKVTEAWTVSATQSLKAYNDIVSFSGAAKNVQTIPVLADTVKALANKADFGGRLLSDWVYRAFGEGTINAFVESLDRSLAKGWGYQRAVKDLLGTAIDSGFGITQRQCITIARSYIQQASVNAQLAVYEKNKDIIKGVKWTAILDNRVCPLCASVDGNIYLWGQPRPPMRRHDNCRCIWTPVLKSWRELGIDRDELEEVAQPWVIREPGPVGAGGRKILYAGTTKENFSGWWKTLPVEQQIQSIGPIRTRLINSGKLTWKDLVDKSTGRYYTLEQLGFDQAGNPLR